MSPGTGMYFISNGGGVDEASSSPLYFSSLENQKEAEVAPTDLRLFRRLGLFLSMFLLTRSHRGLFLFWPTTLQNSIASKCYVIQIMFGPSFTFTFSSNVVFSHYINVIYAKLCKVYLEYLEVNVIISAYR